MTPNSVDFLFFSFYFSPNAQSPVNCCDKKSICLEASKQQPCHPEASQSEARCSVLKLLFMQVA